MRGMKPQLSTISLIAANLIPLVGVFALGWDAGVLVVLYWTENVIVGSFNVLKIASVKSETLGGHAIKLFLIPFFCVHFGIFCAVHGFFLRTLFPLPSGVESLLPNGEQISLFFLPNLAISLIRQLSLATWGLAQWAIVGLFASHGISFVLNFLLGREYETLSIGRAMFSPYLRLVALHIAIIAGAVVVAFFGSSVPYLVVLVLLKTGIDLAMHRKEHAL